MVWTGTSKKEALKVLEEIALDIPEEFFKQISDDDVTFIDSDLFENIELLERMIKDGIK